MDYWDKVEVQLWQSWTEFERNVSPNALLWFIEQGGPRLYTQAQFRPDDYLVFGRETAGLPTALLERHRSHWLRIPMFNPQARSLNLSNCVALVLFEALRQLGFKGEIPPENFSARH